MDKGGSRAGSLSDDEGGVREGGSRAGTLGDDEGRMMEGGRSDTLGHDGGAGMNEGRTSSRVRQWYEDDFDTEPDAVGDATVEGEYASDFEGADASIHEGDSSLLLQLAGQGFESESTKSSGGHLSSTKPDTPPLQLAGEVHGDAATEEAAQSYDDDFLLDDELDADVGDVLTVEEAAALLLRPADSLEISPTEQSAVAHEDARTSSEMGGGGDSVHAASQLSHSPGGEESPMEEATPPGSADQEEGLPGVGDEEHDSVLLEESLLEEAFQGIVGIMPMPRAGVGGPLPHATGHAGDVAGEEEGGEEEEEEKEEVEEEEEAEKVPVAEEHGVGKGEGGGHARARRASEEQGATSRPQLGRVTQQEAEDTAAGARRLAQHALALILRSGPLRGLAFRETFREEVADTPLAQFRARILHISGSRGGALSLEEIPLQARVAAPASAITHEQLSSSANRLKSLTQEEEEEEGVELEEEAEDTVETSGDRFPEGRVSRATDGGGRSGATTRLADGGDAGLAGQESLSKGEELACDDARRDGIGTAGEAQPGAGGVLPILERLEDWVWALLPGAVLKNEEAMVEGVASGVAREICAAIRLGSVRQAALETPSLLAALQAGEALGAQHLDGCLARAGVATPDSVRGASLRLAALLRREPLAALLLCSSVAPPSREASVAHASAVPARGEGAAVPGAGAQHAAHGGATQGLDRALGLPSVGRALRAWRPLGLPAGGGGVLVGQARWGERLARQGLRLLHSRTLVARWNTLQLNVASAGLGGASSKFLGAGGEDGEAARVVREEDESWAMEEAGKLGGLRARVVRLFAPATHVAHGGAEPAAELGAGVHGKRKLRRRVGARGAGGMEAMAQDGDLEPRQAAEGPAFRVMPNIASAFAAVFLSFERGVSERGERRALAAADRGRWPHGLTMGRRIPRKNTSTAREWLPASGGRVLLDPLRLLRLEEEGAGAGGGHAPREATATPLTVTGQMPRGTRGLGVVAAAALSRGSSPAAGEDAELEGSWGHDHKPLGKSTPGAPGYSEEPTPQALLSPRRVHSPPRWDAISGLAAQRAAGRSLRISKEWQVEEMPMAEVEWSDALVLPEVASAGGSGHALFLSETRRAPEAMEPPDDFTFLTTDGSAAQNQRAVPSDRDETTHPSVR